MTTPDLRLSGGRVFLHGRGLVELDIMIDNGVIHALMEPSDPAPAKEVVHVGGRVVLPGAIDPHVHLGKDIRVPREPDEAERESASAVAGGVTSMLVYLMSSDPYVSDFDAAKSVMGQHSHTDFGFHFVLGTRQHLDEVPAYIDLGVSSFKFFMNFRGDEGAYLGMPGNDDSFMYELLGLAADHGAMINPHPENIELVRKLREQPRRDDLGPLAAWNNERPSFVEAEAAQRVAYLASVTGASVYAVHTSSEAALSALVRQRESYDDIFIETCTQYLTLDTSATCGTYGKVNPPLREASDVDRLWEGLTSGEIDCVGSDHNARHKSFKEKDIWTAAAGFPGLGALLPLTLTEGLRRGVSLERLVDALSTRAARLFGLYPRKGTIAPGADADLVVVDLDATTTVRAETQYSAAGYTPWEGRDVPARIVHTIVGGHFAVRDGELSETPRGTYLHRNSSGASALQQIRKESS